MKNNYNSSDLKIQEYNNDLQNEYDDLEGNIHNEKFYEEFYENFKKEQEMQEINKKNQLKREKKKKDKEKLLINSIISLMNEGKSRNEAACEVGVQTYLVTEWINKGLNHEDAHYVYFYKKLKKIEENNANHKEENLIRIKCDSCGELLDFDSKFCSHCGNPVNLQVDPNINYCENCGTKITDNILYFCIECGHPLYKTDK